MSNVRISLSHADFQGLVLGKVVSHGKKRGNRDIFPIEICLQDIGFDVMRNAIDIAESIAIAGSTVDKMRERFKENAV